MRPFLLLAAPFLASACATAGSAAPSVELTAASAPGRGASTRAAAVLSTADRSGEDRALDAPRRAADVLAYLDVSPGMFVAELASGSGYFTELLARSVGTSGLLFAENPPSLLARSGLADAWAQRLTRPPAARIVRLDTELTVPLAARGLDLVYLGYDHDALPSQGIDPRVVDANVWNALRAGGRYVVIGAPESPGRAEIEGFGFRLTSQSRLASAVGPGDWPAAADARSLLTFARP